METNPKLEQFIFRAVLEVQGYADIAKDLGVDRPQLTIWEKDPVNKQRMKELALVRQIFVRKKFTERTIREFHDWYIKTPRKCIYCNFTEKEIQELLDAKKIYTKRIATRGRTLEIERLLPNQPYDDLNNLVYCCYWCNNAKTDEFTAEEFQLIGQVLKIIWSNRLKKAREEKSDL
jgi:hypothetical protein